MTLRWTNTPGNWISGCPALAEGYCLHGKFSLNKFYCFQIIADKSVYSLHAEAGSLESLLHLAGLRLALSTHPDVLISEASRAGVMGSGQDLKHHPPLLDYAGKLDGAD